MLYIKGGSNYLNIYQLKTPVLKTLLLILSLTYIVSFLGCIEFSISYFNHSLYDYHIKTMSFAITMIYAITLLISLYGFIMILINKFKIGKIISFLSITISLLIILLIQINNNLSTTDIINFIEPDYIFVLGLDLLSGGFFKKSNLGILIINFFTSSLLYTYKLIILNCFSTLLTLILLPNEKSALIKKSDTIKGIRILSVFISIVTTLSIIGGIDILIYRKDLSFGFLEFLHRNYALLISELGLIILTSGLICIAVRKYYEGRILTLLGTLFLIYNIFASVKLSDMAFSELSESVPIDFFFGDALSLLTFSIDSDHNILGIGKFFTSSFISEYKLIIILIIISIEIVLFIHLELKKQALKQSDKESLDEDNLKNA